MTQGVEMLPVRIALEELTPSIVAAFADDTCLIWSGEWQAYWRDGGHGYTKAASEAGLYTIQAAYARTRHCGPEKQIAFERSANTRPAAAGSVRGALEKVQDFLREPDHAEHFGTDQLLEWINRRPTHIIPKLLATAPTPDAAASGFTAIAAGPAKDAVADLEQFLFDHSGNEETAEGMEAEDRAHQAMVLVRQIVRAAMDLCDGATDDCTAGRIVTVDGDDFDQLNAALDDVASPDAAASEAGEVWQGIATCEGWRHDFQRPMLAYWTTRGVCETYWDTDEDFDTRPKWWPSPREGWRAPGDQCIPVNQDSVTHWMRMPAPPAALTTQGGAEA